MFDTPKVRRERERRDAIELKVYDGIVGLIALGALLVGWWIL